MSYYTDRKKADGLGSSSAGTEHFIHQRITAVALVPLILLFMFFVAPLVGEPAEVVKEGFQGFGASAVTIITAIFAGLHLVQGLQVVIEDYVANKASRIFLLFAMKTGIAILVITIAWALIQINLA